MVICLDLLVVDNISIYLLYNNKFMLASWASRVKSAWHSTYQRFVIHHRITYLVIFLAVAESRYVWGNLRIGDYINAIGTIFFQAMYPIVIKILRRDSSSRRSFCSTLSSTSVIFLRRRCKRRIRTTTGIKFPFWSYHNRKWPDRDDYLIK